LGRDIEPSEKGSNRISTELVITGLPDIIDRIACGDRAGAAGSYPVHPVTALQYRVCGAG